jgi:hypothetical protein
MTRVFISAIGVSDQPLHEPSCRIFIVYPVKQKLIRYRITPSNDLHLALYDLYDVFCLYQNSMEVSVLKKK